MTGAIIEAEVIETKVSTVREDSGYNEGACCLDWDRVSGPLEVRNWRPGDQYRPAGHLGDEKMKILFQRERIPLWERRSWPIITNHDQIVWARRFGPAFHAAATPDSNRIQRSGGASITIFISGCPDSICSGKQMYISATCTM